MGLQRQINAGEYTSAGFIRHYQKLVTEEMIPYQYRVLHDEVPGVAKSHAVQNFINAASALKNGDKGDGFYGFVFQDSDIAKWIEAAAFSLVNMPDAKLEADVDAMIELVRAAQDEDGYVNTYFTIDHKDRRMQDLQEGHELYVAGHMTEAATAYYEATGKDVLLKVCEKNMEYFYKYFIEEKHEGYPGHPEIELALVKLYQATGNKHALELSDHFLRVRGVDPDFFRKESEKRGWQIFPGTIMNPRYNQAHLPLREQKAVYGHAVRAVYLLTGAAKTAELTDDQELMDACLTLWDNLVHKRMYITGGIGSTGTGEAFTEDYDLPNDTVYAETCASIGLMFFASAMLEHEVKAEYADVMEQAFYNTVIAGMQLDGKRYFYVNPLEVIPGISGVAVTHLHDLPERPGWYACACCPPNVARLVESFGKYAYGENKDTAFCHMYAAGRVVLDNGIVFTCETGYPYDFTVTYKTETAGRMAIRIPGWSKQYILTINGEAVTSEPMDGYVYLAFSEGDEIVLKLSDAIRVMHGNTKVAALNGKAALMRGPLVYCFEGVDNEQDILSLFMKRNGCKEALPFNAEKLSGIVEIKAEGYREIHKEELYTDEEPSYEAVTLNAIPYYAWANRGANEMRVWLPLM